MQLLPGNAGFVGTCFPERTACSLCLLSKSEIRRVPQVQGVMELQGDILQGRLMFSCSLSPMDRGSITHLMCPLNWGPPAPAAPSLQSSGVLGTLPDGLARVEGTMRREKQGKK